MNSDFKNRPVAVIGLGLMGGSFAERQTAAFSTLSTLLSSLCYQISLSTAAATARSAFMVWWNES